MRIACIGDSCTFGQNVRQDQAWPHLLWEMTGEDVRNLGVNGDTSRLGLERWHRDVELVDPDVVVIQFGHNDVNLWHNRPRVFKDAYRANIKEMQTRCKKAIVLWPHLAEVQKDVGYNTRLKIWSEYRTHTLPILDDGYGVHPDPEGHRWYAEYVKAKLDS